MAQSKASTVAKGDAPAARSYLKLGQVLVEENVITKKELRQALAQQKADRKQNKQRMTLGPALMPEERRYRSKSSPMEPRFE